MELFLAGGGVHEVLRGLHAGVHVGELELRVLELAEAAPELHALFRVLNRLFHGAFAEAQRLRRDSDTPAVEGLHGNLEALALTAQKVFLRHNAIFKNQVARRGAANAHLLFVLARREARERLLYDKGRNAPVALRLVGHGEYDERVGDVAVGDEALGAVQHVMVAFEYGEGLLSGGVRAGVGFGEAERADFTPGE